jgi:cytochrome c
MTARTMLMTGLLVIGMTVASAVVRAESKQTPGEAAYKKECVNCHSLIPGMSTIAPDLHGIMGRKVGSLPDYKYSDDLKKADFTWTPAKMDQWLKSPHGMIPGTEMSYPGQKDAKKRAEIVEFVEHMKAK